MSVSVSQTLHGMTEAANYAWHPAENSCQCCSTCGAASSSSSSSRQPLPSSAARLLLLPKASDAAPADDWGGLGGWALALGGEGGRAKAADVDPGGMGMDAVPLLLLDISPVAVSAEYQNSPHESTASTE